MGAPSKLVSGVKWIADKTGNILGYQNDNGIAILALQNSVVVLGANNVAQSKDDADANESAALFSLLIPANTLLPNSALRFRSFWKTNSSAATKRLRGRFGGNVV